MNKKIPVNDVSLSVDKATGISREQHVKARQTEKIRILVVMKQGIFRAGLEALLKGGPDFEVVGQARDCKECCRCVDDYAPDVLLCGLDKDCSGTVENVSMQSRYPRALGELCHVSPTIPVIILHDDNDEWTLWKTVRTGVRGYLTTNTSPDYLFLAIREAYAGGFFIEPALQSRLLDHFRNPEQGKKTENQTLTKREWEVLSLLSQGMRNKGIADELFLSQSAVKHHVSTLLRKFKASNRTEAVRTAITRGLIDPPT